MFRAKLVFLSSFLVTVMGCGYSFQHTRNPLLDRYGVRKIYVAPLANNTYKPGVENLVHNELLRVISQNRRVLLVPNAQDADAVLQGNVNVAVYTSAATTSADKLFSVAPNVGSAGQIVPTVYQAELGCSFNLNLSLPRPGQPKVLWGSTFSRTKTFPGNNQIGVFGDTAALINDSEFDRSLHDLARSMMADVHESMLAQF